MIKLDTNWSNMLGRFIMLGGSIVLIIALFTKTPQIKNLHKIIFWKVTLNHIFYLLILVILYLVVLLLVSFFKIASVEAYENEGEIILTSLLKSQKLSISNIQQYSVTIKKNGYKSFYGLLLELKDGTKIQLAQQNINNLDELKSLLAAKNITYAGETKPGYPFN